ncbi:MAG TPA: hypothetical protein VIG94_01465 [Faecalibacter sp.]
MKKHLFILCALGPILAFAQVGINTNEPQASLDVQAAPHTTTVSDGIIAPRLTGDQLKAKDSAYQTPQTGAIVYVTQRLTSEPTSKTIKVKDPGYYYFDGEIWQAVESTQQKQDWFYMPSFNLDMSSLEQKTVDLYANYRSQFTKQSNKYFSSINTTSLVSNLEAPLFEAHELEYIVTFYDERYITIHGITPEGVMTYTVNNTNPPVNSFINIILKPLK